MTERHARDWQVKPDLHLMLVDGKVEQVDMGPVIERHRRAHVRARADAIDQASALLMDEAFDLEGTWDAAAASGMPEPVIESAGNVALALWRIERLRRD